MASWAGVLAVLSCGTPKSQEVQAPPPKTAPEAKGPTRVEVPGLVMELPPTFHLLDDTHPVMALPMFGIVRDTGGAVLMTPGATFTVRFLPGTSPSKADCVPRKGDPENARQWVEVHGRTGCLDTFWITGDATATRPKTTLHLEAFAVAVEGGQVETAVMFEAAKLRPDADWAALQAAWTFQRPNELWWSGLVVPNPQPQGPVVSGKQLKVDRRTDSGAVQLLMDPAPVPVGQRVYDNCARIADAIKAYAPKATIDGVENYLWEGSFGCVARVGVGAGRMRIYVLVGGGIHSMQCHYSTQNPRGLADCDELVDSLKPRRRKPG